MKSLGSKCRMVPFINQVYSNGSLIVFDLDGTLANIEHRLHHIEKPDWDAFFEACDGDSPINSVIELLRDFSLMHYTIIVSGRSSQVAEKTLKWLDDHDAPFHALYMRREGDTRQDHVIKEEWLHALDPATRAQIAAVFDDRKQVVDMWRRNDLLCCQVAEGDF